ncbi:MAG: hypothetical protein QF890_13350 [Myxococcota bacterium]|jgi:hypothetical protein|nr:hypothetical protein [bacterium]MDP6075722.1 hypothetical protein [Myxococcota bacterium]MDP6243328.1 hypothetical protein [Myxococcota bacterium]MDP7075466.1 hypothetical protein [Myxococcota bacterium]MDP7299629.1 hypothetical protein [Myxococcota bacterium]
MRARERTTTMLGLLSLLASVALLSPGVRAEPAESAGRCGSPPTGSDAKVEAFVESLRREHERSALATDDVVALNNRGYNYGPPPRVELDEILTEVRGQR